MVLVKLLNLFVCVSVLGVVRSAQHPKRVYSNEFAVHIPEGPEVAETIASKHGFINRGQVREYNYCIYITVF